MSRSPDLSRRGLIRSMAAGSILMPGLLSELLAGETAPGGAKASSADPLAPRAPHFPARAKRVIFLHMSGGVSHVESWDPKPRLIADAGKTITVPEFQGRKGSFEMFLKGPQWKFAPHGSRERRSASCFRTWPDVSMICA